MDDRRLVLVDFIAAEHRLRRQAVREAQEVDLWTRREAFALERHLDDMAAEARARAARHLRRERGLLEQAEEIRAEIAEMRAGLAPILGGGRAPPGPDLDSRLARLEIEAEIDAIRAATVARGRDNDPEPSSDADG